MEEFLKIATLSESDVAKIRELEKETGTHIMAFKPGLSIAKLDEDDLLKVKALETKLGATLLVFKSG